MSIFNRKKILVTHNGSFHSDDLFASAVLSIVYKNKVEIIRTRDTKKIEEADIVYDVGGIYDPDKDRFDHHQKEGAGIRENGIPYSSFGLVWKKYGEKICGSLKVSEIIDKKIVQPIDAIDNGVDFAKPLHGDVVFYGPDQVFMNNVPTWKESNENVIIIFNKLVKKVSEFLRREIEVTKADLEGGEIITKTYLNSSDKRIIILENDFPRYLYQNTLSILPEPVYVIFPSDHSGLWKVEAIRKSPSTMENRKLFPESWRGLSAEDNKLKELTGVEGVLFCHRGGFLINVKSKEGAIILAEKALSM